MKINVSKALSVSAQFLEVAEQAAPGAVGLLHHHHGDYTRRSKAGSRPAFRAEVRNSSRVSVLRKLTPSSNRERVNPAYSRWTWL